MANGSNGNGQQTAIAKSAVPEHIKRLHSFLKPRMSQLADYAGSLVKPEQLVRLACYEASRPESSWMETCSPESIYASLIIAAQLGLEPGHVLGEGYFVPFKGKCSFIPGYRGLVKLARQSGQVKSIDAVTVFAGDDFAVMRGTERWIKHVVPYGEGRRADSGKSPEVIAAYAIATLLDGDHSFDVLDRWELDKHRAASQMSNGPAWAQWPEEMYKKTAIRRASKLWPLGGRFAIAAKVDEAHDTGKVDDLRGVIDIPDEGVAERGDVVQVIEKPSRIQEAAERAATSKPATGDAWTFTDPDPEGKVRGTHPDGRSAVIEQTGQNTVGWWVFNAEGAEVASGERKSRAAAMDDVKKAK